MSPSHRPSLPGARSGTATVGESRWSHRGTQPRAAVANGDRRHQTVPGGPSTVSRASVNQRRSRGTRCPPGVGRWGTAGLECFIR